jgi:hypothetical protein
MLSATTTQTTYVNAPESGAIFSESDSTRIFGRIHLNGNDQRIEGAVDLSQETPVMTGRVQTVDGEYRLRLRFVETESKGEGKATPNWIGTLTCDNLDYKKRLVGWTNQSRAGREYIRLRAKS